MFFLHNKVSPNIGMMKGIIMQSLHAIMTDMMTVTEMIVMIVMTIGTEMIGKGNNMHVILPTIGAYMSLAIGHVIIAIATETIVIVNAVFINTVTTATVTTAMATITAMSVLYADARQRIAIIGNVVVGIVCVPANITADQA